MAKTKNQARRKAREAENFSLNKVKLVLSILRNGQKPNKSNSLNFYFRKCAIINMDT